MIWDDEGADSSFLNFPFRSNYAVKLTQNWPKTLLGKNQ